MKKKQKTHNKPWVRLGMGMWIIKKNIVLTSGGSILVYY